MIEMHITILEMPDGKISLGMKAEGRPATKREGAALDAIWESIQSQTFERVEVVTEHDKRTPIGHG